MDITILLTERLKAEYSVEQVDAITYTIRLKRFEGERKPPLFIKLQNNDNQRPYTGYNADNRPVFSDPF